MLLESLIGAMTGSRGVHGVYIVGAGLPSAHSRAAETEERQGSLLQQQSHHGGCKAVSGYDAASRPHSSLSRLERVHRSKGTTAYIKARHVVSFCAMCVVFYSLRSFEGFRLPYFQAGSVTLTSLSST